MMKTTHVAEARPAEGGALGQIPLPDGSVILLTGGCGFIGTNLARWLLTSPLSSAMSRLVVLDNMSAGSDEANLAAIRALADPRFVFALGDYGCRDTVVQLLRSHAVTHIMHLAGETHVDRSYADPEACARINVMSTLTFLDACRCYHAERPLAKILYMSTDEVYGDINPHPSSETRTLSPTNPYSASKAAAEMFVSAYHHSFKLPLCIVRSNNVYGPYQAADKVVPKFISRCLAGLTIDIHGAGSQTRNWINVDDVCSALHAVLTRGTCGDTYNIGTGDELSVLCVAREILGIVDSVTESCPPCIPAGGEDPRIRFVEDRPHNDKYYHVDWSKIRNELGWHPAVEFTRGLDRTVLWYVLNRQAPQPQSDSPPWRKSETDLAHPPVVREAGGGEAASRSQSSGAPTCDGESDARVALVFGSRGWIASQMLGPIALSGFEVVCARTRPGDDPDAEVEREFEEVRPTHVFSLLGRTHGPGCSTIDYLEGGPEKLALNLRDNLYAPVLLADLCEEFDAHLTYVGTGCIFEYGPGGPEGTKRFDENDDPTFFGSAYSVTKGVTDRIMRRLCRSAAALESATGRKRKILNARIRMPVSDSEHPRNFVTKIAGYEKVINIPNSVTVLPELLPLLVDMAARGVTGTVNLVNPDPISHNEVLELYKEIIDPDFQIRNFTLEEQNAILKAGRSNCTLDASLLCSMYPGRVSSTRDAVRACLREMAKYRYDTPSFSPSTSEGDESPVPDSP